MFSEMSPLPKTSPWIAAWSVNSWSFNFSGRPGYLVLPWLEGILISTNCLMVPLNILSQSWLHPLLQTHVTNVCKDF